MLKWLGERLQEPSTHAALAATVPIANAVVQAVPQGYGLIIAGVFALLGVALPEKRS